MKPLQNNFREGAPISQVPASWFNAVASFINSLIPGFGISWVKSEANNVIELDPSITNGLVRTVNGEAPDSAGDVEIDVVSTVDGHSPDENGAVSFGLAASKWVKTDSSGHLATTNDTPVTLPSGTTGQTGSMTFVTGVSWNGTQLVISRVTITFTNGVATSYTTLANQTIDTVAFSTT